MKIYFYDCFRTQVLFLYILEIGEYGGLVSWGRHSRTARAFSNILT